MWYGTQLSITLVRLIIANQSSDICLVTHLDISCLFYQWYSFTYRLVHVIIQLSFIYSLSCFYCITLVICTSIFPLFLAHSLGHFL